ncbi:2-methoxy-6-polyprenyl-1,4-benzoquinol methylase [hydrothermal vent metagenome]|uniref:2-methoxy-6-polyprenyl-1,4-benzoquinol methylase n=1 Tax=hydrothermal vent metagenome TaxID=652676 RepID=A0A3B0TNK2_9ZZZZ
MTATGETSSPSPKAGARTAAATNADTSAKTWVDFGFSRVGETEKAAHVAEVFGSVADKYDLMNDVMSAGLHRLWKDAMVAWLRPGRSRGGYRHLDVAGGTGDIAFRVARAGGASTRSLVLDINPAMIAQGRKRPDAAALAPQIAFAVGDAETLPLADRSMDAYTIAFGIRNVTDKPRALAEARRVLKTGGRFLCLEFSHVDVPVLDQIYELYSMNVIPGVGSVVAGDADAYRYLVESIRRFPDQPAFGAMIGEAGFARVSWRPLTGGVAAIHSGWRL